MTAEMAEQPDVLAALAGRREELVARVRGAVPESLAGIVLVARGSSDNAAVYGRYVLELSAGRPVALAAPSLHTLYAAKADYRGYLAVAVSQSGRTPEIVTVTERLRRAGAATVSVTNEADSPLAEAADALVDLGAGVEEAVPATKTYTATVAAFAIIAEAFGDCPWGDADWKRLPAAVAEVLDDPAGPERAAEEIGDAPGAITVGRGFLYSTALEAALKLKETTSILAEGFSAADLRHGPIAVIEQEFPVMAFSAPGPAAADMTALVGEVRDRGGRVLTVAVDDGADLPLPDGLAEPFVPLPAVVRAQQVARALALHRGLDPDSPEGLRKVTPTT